MLRQRDYPEGLIFVSVSMAFLFDDACNTHYFFVCLFAFYFILLVHNTVLQALGFANNIIFVKLNVQENT